MQINRIIFLIALILIQGCAPTSNDISKNNLHLTKNHFKYVDIYSLDSLQININKHRLVPKIIFR